MEKLTTTQAAKILGVNQSRIRQLLASGELEGEKFGRDWCIYADSVYDRVGGSESIQAETHDSEDSTQGGPEKKGWRARRRA